MQLYSSINVADIWTRAGTIANLLSNHTISSPWLSLVISWLYYLAANEEDNWNKANISWIASKLLTYIWTGANHG